MGRKIVAYLRLSTVEQDLRNQRYKIITFADKKAANNGMDGD